MKPMLDLQPHGIALALLQPQIAPNTGNIARLCVAAGCHLHLVRPMGFVLDDRKLRRSAMDYWPRLQYTVHSDNARFFSTLKDRRFWLFDSSGTSRLWDVQARKNDLLIFGSETRGIDPSILEAYPRQVVRIPQVPNERCINLATAAGIATYEFLRQIHREF